MHRELSKLDVGTKGPQDITLRLLKSLPDRQSVQTNEMKRNLRTTGGKETQLRQDYT